MKIYTQDDKPKRTNNIKISSWVFCSMWDDDPEDPQIIFTAAYDFQLDIWIDDDDEEIEKTEKFQWVYPDEVFKKEKV